MAAYLSIRYWWLVVNRSHTITGHRLFFCLQHLSLFSSWIDKREESNIYYMYFHPHFDKLSQSYSCSQHVNKGTPSSYYLKFVSYISLGTKYIHLTLIYHESVSESSTLTFATSLSSSSSCWFVKVFNLHMLVHFSWFTRQEVCRPGTGTVHLQDINCNTDSGAVLSILWTDCRCHLCSTHRSLDLWLRVNSQGSVAILQPGTCSSPEEHACAKSLCMEVAGWILPLLLLQRRGGSGVHWSGLIRLWMWMHTFRHTNSCILSIRVVETSHSSPRCLKSGA